MPNRKVLMYPTPTEAAKDTTNAIHQIVLQLQKFLPEHGWEITENPDEVDLVAGHAGQTAGRYDVDVAHCHGLYPTAINPEPGWHWAANEHVIRNLKVAKAITVPSAWVADIIRRDMCVEPHIVPWAIPPGWKKSKHHKGYTLWNKTRQDGVCDPTPLLRLAEKESNIPFMTTFGEGGANVTTIGRQPYEEMKKVIAGAAIYLATTKETFGIGTLEAMACGIPILGYNWGSTANLVEHGVTGYLVEPGDIDGLQRGLHWCLKHRETVGANARKMAIRYTWQNTAEQIASVYNQVIDDIPTYEHNVGVVIPCHNYERYIGHALMSVLSQDHPDFEVVVVFDNCTDNSEIEVQYAYDHHIAQGGRAIPLRTARVNYGGPAKTRNHGIAMLQTRYILPLDADDRLGNPAFLSTLSNYLDENSGVGMAYTGLMPVGSQDEPLNLSRWPDGYDFEKQVKGFNQVPTCNMFRREAWRRAGGYRTYVEPAEDAELWTRIGALGWTGKQVTQERWFVYRMHDQSLSHPIRIQARPHPNFLFFHPWTNPTRRPLACDGRPQQHSWSVRNYDKPQISIIIPVGPSHTQLLPYALDSVYGQTELNWECIVVNDSGGTLPIEHYPWVRVVNIGVGNGAGYARNRGVEAAKAPLIAFLDADDMYYASFLEECLKAYRRTGRYVYTDWTSENKNGMAETHRTPDFVVGDVFRQTSTHSIAVLMERAWHKTIGGFDENMPAWEDTDYFLKLQAHGYCAVRVGQPLLYYRYTTGTRRELGETLKEELKSMLYNRYRDWIEDHTMCGCNSNQNRVRDVDIQALNGDMVRVEYNGPEGNHDVIGLHTKTRYGRRRRGDVFMVWADDIKAAPNAYMPILDPTEIIPETPEPGTPTKVMAG